MLGWIIGVLQRFEQRKVTFTPLGICVHQQQTRSQLQKFIRLYTLFQNNDHVIWYICPIFPSTSPTFWQNSLKSIELKWEFAIATNASLVVWILATGRVKNHTGWGQGCKENARPQSHPLWEPLSSYWTYANVCYCGGEWISSSILVFFIYMCEQSFQNLTIILRIGECKWKYATSGN